MIDESNIKSATRVDVVMKSEQTKRMLLSGFLVDQVNFIILYSLVLKRHFLFQKLRDFELDDVIGIIFS